MNELEKEICNNCGKTLREQMKGCNKIDCYRQFLTKQETLKEEPKHFVECKCTNALQAENCIRNCGHGEEPKQETLEEAAEKYINDDLDLYESLVDGHISYNIGIDLLNKLFIAGVKWQQEQDKKLYSEEEVDKLNMKYYRVLGIKLNNLKRNKIWK